MRLLPARFLGPESSPAPVDLEDDDRGLLGSFKGIKAFFSKIYSKTKNILPKIKTKPKEKEEPVVVVEGEGGEGLLSGVLSYLKNRIKLPKREEAVIVYGEEKGFDKILGRYLSKAAQKIKDLRKDNYETIVISDEGLEGLLGGPLKKLKESRKYETYVVEEPFFHPWVYRLFGKKISGEELVAEEPTAPPLTEERGFKFYPGDEKYMTFRPDMI